MFTTARWQVALHDPIWQVILCSSEVGSHNELYTPLSDLIDPKLFFVLLDASVLSDVSGLREELLTILEHALFGDRLAAEFLLCHLASSV